MDPGPRRGRRATGAHPGRHRNLRAVPIDGAAREGTRHSAPVLDASRRSLARTGAPGGDRAAERPREDRARARAAPSDVRPAHDRRASPRSRRGRRPQPPRVDETYTAALPPTCPACGRAVQRTRVATQYQEDLPIVRPVVRRFEVPVGWCGQCGRRVQGRHPLQTSEALGAAHVHLARARSRSSC